MCKLGQDYTPWQPGVKLCAVWYSFVVKWTHLKLFYLILSWKWETSFIPVMTPLFHRIRILNSLGVSHKPCYESNTNSTVFSYCEPTPTWGTRLVSNQFHKQRRGTEQSEHHYVVNSSNIDEERKLPSSQLLLLLLTLSADNTTLIEFFQYFAQEISLRNTDVLPLISFVSFSEDHIPLSFTNCD
jgi:hypothetical protein